MAWGSESTCSSSAKPPREPMPAKAGRVAVRGAEREFVTLAGDGHVLAGMQPAVEQHRRQLVVDLALDRAAQRPGAELGLEAAPGEPVDRFRREVHRDILRVQAAGGLLEEQAGDLPQLRLVEVPEDDDLVDAVEELRTERLPQAGHDAVAQLRVLRVRRGRRRRGAV